MKETRNIKQKENENRIITQTKMMTTKEKKSPQKTENYKRIKTATEKKKRQGERRQ